MAPRKSKSKKVDRDKSSIYRNRATEFYDQMIEAFDLERWSVVGLLAVHCAISINDAVCCQKIGEISNGSHGDAAKFLATQLQSAEAKNKAAQLSQILSSKNLVEYEGREFTEKDARQIFKLAERFYAWAYAEL